MIDCARPAPSQPLSKHAYHSNVSVRKGSVPEFDLIEEVHQLRVDYEAAIRRVGPLGPGERIPVWSQGRWRRSWCFGPLARRFVESHVAVSIDRLDKGVRLQCLGGPDDSSARRSLGELQQLREGLTTWPRSVPLLNVFSLALAAAPFALGANPDFALALLLLLTMFTVGFFAVVALAGYRPRRAALGNGWSVSFNSWYTPALNSLLERGKGRPAFGGLPEMYWDFDREHDIAEQGPPMARRTTPVSAREAQVFAALPVRRPRELPFDVYFAVIGVLYVWVAVVVLLGADALSGSFTLGSGLIVLWLVLMSVLFVAGIRIIWTGWRKSRLGETQPPRNT